MAVLRADMDPHFDDRQGPESTEQALSQALNAEFGAERALVRVSGLYGSPIVAM